MTNQELKQFRDKNKLTQKDLSLFLGYKDPNTIQKWEYGILKIPVLVERTLKLFDELNETEKEKFILNFTKH